MTDPRHDATGYIAKPQDLLRMAAEKLADYVRIRASVEMPAMVIPIAGQLLAWATRIELGEREEEEEKKKKKWDAANP